MNVWCCTVVLYRHCNRIAFAMLCWAVRVMGKERDNSLLRHRSSGARRVVEIMIAIYNMLCFGPVWFCIDTVPYDTGIRS